VSAWQSLPEFSRKADFEHSRCVVLDVETTGLNLMTDALISIGAVAVVKGRIALDDSFYVVLRQSKSSGKKNILVHGISGSAQRKGDSPADALLEFLEYLGKDPLVAFHAAFDETMIRRAMRQYLGISFKHLWLDMAFIMPALFPDLMYSHPGLDDWSAHFGIRNEDRHNAMADALVTAQLLLIAINTSRQTGNSSYSEMRNIERAYRNARGS